MQFHAILAIFVDYLDVRKPQQMLATTLADPAAGTYHELSSHYTIAGMDYIYIYISKQNHRNCEINQLAKGQSMRMLAL